MARSYAGGCPCGAVRFRAELDLVRGAGPRSGPASGAAPEWKIVLGADAFRLVSGAGELSESWPGNRVIEHRFCRHCGAKIFGTGRLATIGDFYAINLACLDDAGEAAPGMPR